MTTDDIGCGGNVEGDRDALDQTMAGLERFVKEFGESSEYIGMKNRREVFFFRHTGSIMK